MLKLKIIENHCKNGNRTLLEAPMGNMEEITQFQYNLENLVMLYLNWMPMN